MRTGVTALTPEDMSKPLETLLNLFVAHDWPCHMRSSEEIVAEVPASWGVFQIRAIWRDEDKVLQLLCLPEIRIADDHLHRAYELISLINEQVWLGHFEIWSHGKMAVYRHGLMLGRDAALSLADAQSVIEAAVAECERFYPAFQFVLWGDKEAQDALDAAVVDPAGEA